MKSGYRHWLDQQKYDSGTINTQIARTRRVEEYYGDLDNQYAVDGLAGITEVLRYTTADQRRKRPNPSKIPIDGDIHNNLASYRSSVQLYRRFRDAVGDVDTDPPGPPRPDGGEYIRCIGLERDLQAALRADISQLELGLTIIDEGAERTVDSGQIDITACDELGRIVVIELKAGAVERSAISQLLSYMGDIAEEEDSAVRGILVGSSFDARTKAAARVVPNIALRKYSVRFSFSDGHA